MKKKIYILLLAFLPVLASIGIQLAAAVLVGFWFSVVTVVRLLLEGISDPESLLAGTVTLLLDPLFNDILMIVTFVALVVVFLIWYRKQKGKPAPTPFNEAFCIRNITIILISGLAAQVAVSMCLNLVLPLFPDVYERYSALIENLVGGNVIVSVVSTAVLAPIAEELIFRELMTKQLRQIFPFWIANLIQALAFGVYHMNIVQAVYAFFLGLLLGYVAYRMRSIKVSILLHSIVNASGLVLDIILPDALFESTMGMIIFAVLCSAIAILLTLLYRFPNITESIDGTIPTSDLSISVTETEPACDTCVLPTKTPKESDVSDDFASCATEANDSDEPQNPESL